MNLLQRALGRHGEQRYGLDDYFKDAAFSFNGTPYAVMGTGGAYLSEEYDSSFTGYVQALYKSDGPVFATILARMLLFTEARFQWQRINEGRPGDLFGTRELAILERPWPNGTTGELLARMEQDVSLAGNFYAVREGNRLRRLRPDWVEIVLTAPPAEAVAADVAGYRYTPGGGGTAESVTYLREQVCHWSPIPDPDALYKGMSWLTPVLEEVRADKGATRHKGRFFDNAATPSLTVAFKESVTEQQFDEFMEQLKESHQGADRAYKTMFLAGGADVKVVGADLKQMDFKATQGAGETRIAMAGGVPPIIVGMSEGLASATYSNYGMARRKFGDHWARPQWRSACAALEAVLAPPPGAQPGTVRLWYDDRDIAFLREDEQDRANIQAVEAQTIRTLSDTGCDFESIVAAVTGGDWNLLEHSGLFSVQLQPPGTAKPEPAAEQPADGDGEPEPEGSQAPGQEGQ